MELQGFEANARPRCLDSCKAARARGKALQSQSDVEESSQDMAKLVVEMGLTT